MDALQDLLLGNCDAAKHLLAGLHARRRELITAIMQVPHTSGNEQKYISLKEAIELTALKIKFIQLALERPQGKNRECTPKPGD